MSDRSNPFEWLTDDLMPRWLVAIRVYCYGSTRYFYWLYAIIISLVIAFSSYLEADFASFDEGTFDTIMEWRWTSPKASQEIVILDIDEKSLAEMGSKGYGNYPWARDVYAQVLAELEYVEPKSIMFVQLITDPDEDHEQSDAVLNFVASESYVTIYPVVRLPSKNDKFSKLKVSNMGMFAAGAAKGDKTVAAIIPALPGMRHDLAIMNHKLDDDGVLRTWNLTWEEDEWSMPTMVGGAISKIHVDDMNVPKSKLKNPDQSYILNWRNGKNRHQRVSFVDYLSSLDGSGTVDLDLFRDKHVIIATSAPGLATLISTPVGMLDNCEVYATALDDAINGTNLQQMPEWATSLSAVGFVWGMALLFMFGRSQQDLDNMFVAIEIGALLVMALAINYSTYFIDIMPLATFGLIYYTVARVHHESAESIFMGAEEYMKKIVTDDRALDSVGIIVFRDDEDEVLPGKRELIAIQEEFNAGNIFYCKELFQDDQILEAINNVICMVVVAESNSQHDILETLQDKLKQRGLKEHITKVFEFPEKVKKNRDLASNFITMKTIAVIAQLPLDEG